MFFSWSWSYNISSIYSVYSSGRKHALRGSDTSRTISVKPLQSSFEESLHSRQSFWYGWQITQTHSSTRRDERYKQQSANLKKVREFSRHPVRLCLALNFDDNINHSHSHRCQPLTDSEARATQRSFTGYGVPHDQKKYRHSFTGCKHIKAYLFRWSTCSMKIGVNESFLAR